MAPKSNTNTSIVCAERISLLYLLHPVPTFPSRTLVDRQSHLEQGYTLSLAEERRLVETLAFLSNDREDANHIPALCIQQNSQTSSFEVLLAVNRLDGHDGDQHIERLKTGYENIFAQLAGNKTGALSRSTIMPAKVSKIPKNKRQKMVSSQRSCPCARNAYFNDCAWQRLSGSNRSNQSRTSFVWLLSV